MYKRILVTLDGSELAGQVLPYATVLAKGLGAKLVLFRAYNPVPDAAYPPSGAAWDRMAELIKQDAEEYLAATAKSLKPTGLDISTSAKFGYPAQLILDEAQRQPDTLIVMSTHGRSGLVRGVLGSVADRVLRTGSVPVFLVKSSAKTAKAVKLETVIATLDGSKLAEQVLPHVIGLAKALHLKVVLLSVNEHPRLAIATDGIPTSPNERIFQELEVWARDYLGKIAANVRSQGISNIEEQVTQGLAAHVIADTARLDPNNFVAMTTHGRSGIGRFLLGSVVDRVVRESESPVLVIRAVDKR
jgi:nucleotide-binding universal stress UspA family protein